MNSLAASVKAKTITATIPGNASGTATRTNAARRLYPSTMACSSMSRGTERKKPMSNHTETGMVIVGYSSTKDHLESCSPTSDTRRDKEMKSSEGGTRYTRKIPMPMGPDHFRSRRARLYAAGSASNKVMMTTSPPTMSVLETNVVNGVLSNKY